MAHIYDYAIIGSGLTGLSIAAALSRETDNIVLLEGADFPGGANKKINFPTGPMNNGLRFVPDSVLAEKAIRFMENLLGAKIAADVSEEAPVTYESGGFKTFLGFGDNPSSISKRRSYYNSETPLDMSSQQ